MRQRNNYQSGMVSVLFLAVMIPFVLLMLVVTVEFSHFFGLKDEIQGVVDEQAHEALSHQDKGLLERGIRARMGDISGMAAITAVSSTLTPSRADVTVQAQYRGALFQLLQAYVSNEQTTIAMSVRSRVRVQRTGVLFVLDRRVVDPADVCGQEGRLLGSFIDRLESSWGSLGGSVERSFAVFPGRSVPGVGREAASMLSEDWLSSIESCPGGTGSSDFSAESVSGVFGGSYDAYDVALDVVDIVGRTVISRDVENRTVVVAVREREFNEGYVYVLYNTLSNAANAARTPINLVVAVLGAGNAVDVGAYQGGLFGGTVRVLGVTADQLNGASLVSAVSRSVSDRIVLEY